METIGVDCRFTADGTVQVRQVEVNKQWQTVEQGRQWLDDSGRHVLVMVPGQTVKELLLRSDDLRWEIREIQEPRQQVV